MVLSENPNSFRFNTPHLQWFLAWMHGSKMSLGTRILSETGSEQLKKQTDDAYIPYISHTIHPNAGLPASFSSLWSIDCSIPVLILSQYSTTNVEQVWLVFVHPSFHWSRTAIWGILDPCISREVARWGSLKFTKANFLPMFQSWANRVIYM